MPDDNLIFLGRLHLLGEVADGLTIGHVDIVHPVGFLTLLGGQAGDVLLDERADGSLVKVAHEGEGVVGGIGGALLGNFHDAVQVDLLQVLYIEGLVAPVAV